MLSIEDLQGSKTPLFVRLSTEAMALKDDLESKAITQEDYDAGCVRLLDMKRVQASLDNVVQQQQMAEAFQVLAAFLGKTLGV